MELAILPECFVDTNLIETIAPPVRGYNHQKGCGTVTRIMKTRLRDEFALGIIDKDKTEVDYLNEFAILAKTENLLLHKHATRRHFIIQICPAIERFIINTCASYDISLDDYGLSNNLAELKKASKTVNSKKDIRFSKLFKDLKRKGATEIIVLSNWVTYLRDKNYKVEDKDLIRLVPR